MILMSDDLMILFLMILMSDDLMILFLMIFISDDGTGRLLVTGTGRLLLILLYAALPVGIILFSLNCQFDLKFDADYFSLTKQIASECFS